MRRYIEIFCMYACARWTTTVTWCKHLPRHSSHLRAWLWQRWQTLSQEALEVINLLLQPVTLACIHVGMHVHVATHAMCIHACVHAAKRYTRCVYCLASLVMHTCMHAHMHACMQYMQYMHTYVRDQACDTCTCACSLSMRIAWPRWSSPILVAGAKGSLEPSPCGLSTLSPMERNSIVY